MGQQSSRIAPPVITGCGVLSAIGSGFDAFAQAWNNGRSGSVAVTDLFAEPLPEPEACYMADFDVRQFLGKKGTSFFDRITALGVVGCHLAVQHSGLVVSDENKARIGVVIGTSTGGVKSASDYSRETLVQPRPHLVNPILFPNTILNSTAGQAAIWHSLKGVNATVANGQLSSLAAIRYAKMAIHQGYVDTLLVGGVEEFTPHMAWGLHHMGILQGTGTLAGEGCAILVLEDAAQAEAADRRALAELLACEINYYHGNGQDSSAHLAYGLARCIERALERSGVEPEQVEAISGGATGYPPLDSVEREGVCLALGRQPKYYWQVKKQVGECYSAAGAMQLAALLSFYQASENGNGRISLVLSVGEDGGVGCAVIRGRSA